MNSINSISKYKYTSKNEYPINLEEYVYMVDKSTHEKYLLFKFFNTLSEIAHHVECNIKLYNENNFMIENIEFCFDGDFSQGYFVPEKKLKINSAFNGIKIEIKKITFDTLFFDKGKLERIPVVVADEINESETVSEKENVLKKTKWQKKKDKLDYVTTKKNIGLINKKRYVVRADRVNKTRLAIILTAVFSVIIAAYFITTMVLFSGTSARLYDGDLTYLKTGTDSVTVVQADDGLKNVVIPEMVDKFAVTSIDDGVFKDMTSITSVTFNGKIIIGKNAFNGCTNLNKLNNTSNIVKIGDYGFKGTKIEDFSDFGELVYLGKEAFPEVTVDELYFPKLSLRNNSLANFKGVNKLTFYDFADGTALANVFSNYSINTLKTIVTYDSDVTDAELSNTVVNNVTLLSSNAQIRSDRVNDGYVNRLSVAIGSRTLSGITGVSGNNKKPLNIVEVNKIISFNTEFFKSISVNNIVFNPSNEPTTKNISSITPSADTKTVFISSKLTISDLKSYLTSLESNCPNLTDIYFEGNDGYYDSSSRIRIHNSFSYNSYYKIIS